MNHKFSSFYDLVTVVMSFSQEAAHDAANQQSYRIRIFMFIMPSYQ